MAAAADRPLDGVGVLVTRPAHQSAPLEAALAALGAQVVCHPVIAIEPPSDLAALEAALARLPRADRAVFVSANAATTLADALSARGQGWPPGVATAAVGEATARAIVAAGFPAPVLPRDGADSEALLQCPELDGVAGRRIAIVRGEGGRTALAEALRARGAGVDALVTYRRGRPEADPAALDAFLGLAPRVVTATSGSALDNLLEAAGPARRQALLRSGLVVVSERVAEQATDRGFSGGIVTAVGPWPEAIAAGAVEWIRHDRGWGKP